MQTQVLDRMLKIAEFKGFSANQLAEEIGVSNAYFSQQKKNKGSVGSDKMLKIVSKFPDINPEWLLTGKGEMLRTAPAPSTAPPSLATTDCAERLQGKDNIIQALNTAVQAHTALIQAKDDIIASHLSTIAFMKTKIADLEKDKKQFGKRISRLVEYMDALKKTPATSYKEIVQKTRDIMGNYMDLPDVAI